MGAIIYLCMLCTSMCFMCIFCVCFICEYECFGGSSVYVRGEGKMREVGVGILVSEQYLANTNQDCFYLSQDKHNMPLPTFSS